MNQSMVFGFDVGLTGAMAVIDASGNFVAVEDLPIMYSGKCRWVDSFRLLEFIKHYRQKLPAHAAVEYIHAMPKLSSQSNHSMGLGLGSVMATLQLAGVSVELVSPLTWKRHYKLLFPKDTKDDVKKAAGLSRARMQFPTAQADLSLIKHHNRGEALLIANWALMQLRGKLAA
jgi:hypothetical protein